ncbi:hypothetical protein NHX12_027304 [Muraenolepis orangiensis]|uniref:Uncharacterized protein n=1 Tax=Muraenolepis orangiensis TaxID=630683 RepID=A0A9Q0EDB5_9TELE|nr:hypothetical protein NHX12_027304 [Muraenolepis orangiensis]
MFSRAPLGGQDGHYTGSSPPHQSPKSREQSKATSQSPQVDWNTQGKLQFLGEPGSHEPPHHQPLVEIQQAYETAFTGGPLKRDPFAELQGFSNGHTGGLGTSVLGFLELSGDCHLKAPCTVHMDPSSPELSDLTPTGETSSSDCQDGIGVVEDHIPRSENDTEGEGEEEQDEEAGEGSGNIVHHILKELRGINKIQEEISDLRDYLTSVRGSVDEVSCCVDAVLSEIGEMYSGAAAEPEPKPLLSQTSRVRRGSLGRQNAVEATHRTATSPLLNCCEWRKETGLVPIHTSPKQLRESPSPRKETQPELNDSGHSPRIRSDGPEADLYCLEHHCPHDYQSTSTLSSSNSSVFPEGSDGYQPTDSLFDHWAPVVGKQSAQSGDGGWREEDMFSCTNSRDCSDMWDRWTTEETQSSTAGQSSHSSSEHLTLLFGPHYNSPSSSSSTLVWRPQGEDTNLECDCAANCPFSRSSGYHTTDAYAEDLSSGAFRSLSCSTMLLTDCDESYLEKDSRRSTCNSSARTLACSAESLDREWTDVASIPRDSVVPTDPVSSHHPGVDDNPEHTAETLAASGFDVMTLTKAVLTFKSAFKGAFKKLEGTTPEFDKDVTGQEPEAATVPVRVSIEPHEGGTASYQHAAGEVDPPQNHIDLVSPESKCIEASVYVDCSQNNRNLTSSPPKSPNGATLLTPTEHHSIDFAPSKDEVRTGDGGREGSILDLTPDPSSDNQAGSLAAGPTEAPGLVCPIVSGLIPIEEDCDLDEKEKRRPEDAGHRERIANFQRILREKRQTHRLSKCTAGSRGSHGSQGSQGSYSQEDFNPGTNVLRLPLH